MTVAWLGILIVSLIGLVVASRRAIDHAQELVFGTKMPPFLIGITLMSIGTDLPEIANSVIASVSGHGDINVGDSMGSAVTQITLILGLLPWLAPAIDVGPKRVLVVCSACVAALLAGAWFVSDGNLTRIEAAGLLGWWVIGSFLIWKGTGPIAEPALPVPTARPLANTISLFGALIAVTLSASALVFSFVRLSEAAGIPEYLLTFFVASIGTSLPELFVDVTALRRGLKDVALGDILGSSFVDATLSLGIGPLIAPTAVTAALAVRGAWVAAAAVALVAAVLATRRQHNRLSGTMLIAVYIGVYVAILR